MTGSQYTAWAQAVFGKYLPGMKEEVENWLRPHDGYFIAALRVLSFKRWSGRWGLPPTGLELEEMSHDAYKIGHDLEAIEAQKKGTTLIPAEPIENVTAEQAEENASKLREKLSVIAGTKRVIVPDKDNPNYDSSALAATRIASADKSRLLPVDPSTLNKFKTDVAIEKRRRRDPERPLSTDELALLADWDAAHPPPSPQEKNPPAQPDTFEDDFPEASP